MQSRMSIRKSFSEYEDKDWNAMMEVAVKSHYTMIREFYLIIPAGSHILFTGSQMGIQPHGMVLAYGVTKSAVHALCTNLVSPQIKAQKCYLYLCWKLNPTLCKFLHNVGSYRPSLMKYT